MKKTFLFTLFFYSHYLGISQNWTSEELQKANTAVNINSISSEEKEVIKYLNLARLYPQKFAIVEIQDYLGPAKYGYYLKTSTYKQSLLVELQIRTPVGLLFFDESMFLLASCFAKESGEAGLVGHNRISCLNGFEGECCDYGHNEGKDIAISLLIDHDVPSLGHRKICLDESYDKIGASIKPHKTYGSCCVVDFKRKSFEYDRNKISQNKPNASTQYYKSTYNNQYKYINEPIKTNEKKKINKTKYHKLLSFKIGGNANVLFDDINNLNSSFSNQVSYQLSTMVGFNLGKSKKNTSVGLFGNYGKYNAENTTLLSNSLFSASNNFLEIEGGFLIKEFLRISGGLGYSSSYSINLSSNNYTTFSAGFSLGPKWFKFDIINTVIIPKNNQKIINRPSVGLSFVLNIMNKKSYANSKF